MKKICLYLLAVLSLSACDQLESLEQDGLTESEIAEGLKAALVVGTDTSTKILSANNGYLEDAAVKILLPAAIHSSIETFKSKSINVGFTTVTGADLYDGYQNSTLGINIPGLKTKEDALVAGINHAAENAAGTATPIFLSAINGITIEEASNILFGGNEHAATNYLEARTSVSLFTAYEPKIDNALQSLTIGSNSVVDEYEAFVLQYNAVLNTNVGIGTIGSLMNLQTVSVTDLSAHATQKGLDGLFLKIAEEEEDIRRDPLARVSALLEKIFGALD
jgi:hypothetical protein